MGKGEQADREEEWEHHVEVRGSRQVVRTPHVLWRAVHFKKITLDTVEGWRRSHMEEGKRVNKPLH